MSETFRCDDKDTLVAYLYGEIDADVRREVERHLRTCAACAEDVRGLQAVRRDLETWMPPVPELGFTIVQKPAPVLRPSRWAMAGTMPAWARVAAAALVIGVGAAIANLQVRYGHDGLTVSTGWMKAGVGAPVPVQSPVEAGSNTAEWKPALVALEQQLRAELSEMKRTGAPESAIRVAAPASVDNAAILRRVQAMLEESEERQRQEVASRMLVMNRDFEARRRIDLYNISQSFGTLTNRTFKTAADQQDLANVVRRVASQPIP
jgi:Putative zinc-finger